MAIAHFSLMRVSRSMLSIAVWGFCALCVLGFTAAARSQVISDEVPENIRGLDVIEKFGAQVPLDLELVNSDGKPVTLGQFFNQGRPVILVMVYFRCPMLCPATLQSLTQSINQIDWSVGEKYNIVVVSFDPTEGPEAARKARDAQYIAYDRGVPTKSEDSWVFLTGHPMNTRRLADSVGFPYRYIASTGEYAHPSVFFVLTPGGSVARYLYGLNNQAETFRMALLEAGEGTIGTPLERFILWCSHYNPNSGEYTLKAMWVMKVGATMSAIGVGSILVAMWAWERHRRATALAMAAGGAATTIDGSSTGQAPSDGRTVS